jgi:hypothetical protein
MRNMPGGPRPDQDAAKQFYAKRRFDRPGSSLKKLPEQKERKPDYEIYHGHPREE